MRKTTGEEIELEDDDLVLVEEAHASSISAPAPLRFPASSAPLEPPARPVTADTRARPRKLTPRRILDERVEEGVAGEIFASIAQAREHHSALQVRAVLARPPTLPPVVSHASPPPASEHVAGRLLSVTPPPFARTATRDSTPPPAFVRRSSAHIAVAASPAPARAASSVAPVSLSEATPEPIVIVVRERPKARWVLAAALIGAVCALGGTRLVGRLDAPNDAGPSAAAPPAATSPPVVTAPPAATTPPAVAAPAPLPSTAPAAQPAVMHFDDDQGASILALPAPVVVARPATPRSRASAIGSALPDGSLDLGGAPAPARPTAAPAAPPLAPAPVEPVARKRPLTPEQELAEAQLKASMR